MKPSPREINRMQELGYKGRKGIITVKEQREATKLYLKYPDEYGKYVDMGRLAADRELNSYLN